MTTSRRPALRCVFSVAAGPRLGFGHLMRARALARALGVRPVVALRGGETAARAARAMGFDVLSHPTRALAQAHVVVVDDPSPQHAQRWLERSRRLGITTVTVLDGGLGSAHADLIVDGSISTGVVQVFRPAHRRRGRTKVLHYDSGGRLPVRLSGPSFFILDPGFARASRSNPRGGHRVLIALGGGRHVERLADRLVGAIRRTCPRARIRIAAGLCAGRRPTIAGASWVVCRNGLDRELRRCDIAVVGGGVTLYEACARGRAVVAVPVVPGQRPTVRAAASSGVALAARRLDVQTDASAIADRVALLVGDPRRRLALGKAARRLVDGHGALRVAARIRQLVECRLRTVDCRLLTVDCRLEAA